MVVVFSNKLWLRINRIVFVVQTKPRDMTVHTFCTLLYPNATDLLYREGVYIGKRKLNGSTILLFQLYDFYVEITYLTYRDQVSSINVTNNMAILNPYLSQIDIKEINIT